MPSWGSLRNRKNVRHDLVCHDALSRHDRRAFLRPERTFASSFRAEARLQQMFARIGVIRAPNRRVERVFNPDRKDHRWGKRKLKRD
jgi:hypothetical protein